MSDSESTKDEAAVMLKHGRDLYNSYETAKAAEVLTNLLVSHPHMENSADLHYWLGLSLYNQDRVPDAEEHLAKTRRLMDAKEHGFEYMRSLYFLGMCYSEMAEEDKALDCLDEAEGYLDYFELPKWYEERFEFRILKGETYYELDRYEEALDQFGLASDSISDDDLRARVKRTRVDYELGKTHAAQRETEKAREHLLRVRTLYLDEDLHRSFHRLMLRVLSTAKELREAITHFEILEEIGVPKHYMSETFNLAGRIYYSLGDLAKARRCLKVSELYEPAYDWVAKTNREFLNKLGDGQ